MKNYFVIGFAFFLAACAAKDEGPQTPAQAVQATYDALAKQDSFGVMFSLTNDRKENYVINPTAFHDLMARWKGRQGKIQVIKTKANDSEATVLYNLQITGRDPQTQDSLRARVIKEDGNWKHGY